MIYESFTKELKSYAEDDFAKFQEGLIFSSYKILGVRTPILRKIAKKYCSEVETLMSFPNEYYEVVFIKLCAVSLLPYEQFLAYLDDCVALIDNWALCDSFKPKCLPANTNQFFKEIERIFASGGEFYERFALVMLLNYYIKEEYAEILKEYAQKADTEKYYVHMAVAWLVAEILAKLPTLGEEILKDKLLPTKTHNKAIQKARESFRIDKEYKECLNVLKIREE